MKKVAFMPANHPQLLELGKQLQHEREQYAEQLVATLSAEEDADRLAQALSCLIAGCETMRLFKDLPDAINWDGLQELLNDARAALLSYRGKEGQLQ